MTRKDLVRRIEAVAGLKVVKIDRNKHFKVTVDSPTGRHVLVTAVSPSDWRAWRNNERLLKQWASIN